MRSVLLLAMIHFTFISAGKSQDMVSAAQKFIHLLDTAQKEQALYPFESEERYSYHFFPINDRKGVPLDALNATQKDAAKAFLKTCLTKETFGKIEEIIQLEILLKVLENRKTEDHFRDPGKYFLAIFGIPGDKTIWGWRFEGHHVSFHFSANSRKLVAATPAFLGSNPAVIQDGPSKGSEILKEERELGFAALNSLDEQQRKKAIISAEAPGDIITGINRKVSIEHPEGISYADMTAVQREKLLKLVSLYVHRFTKLFANDMLKEIQKADLNKLIFSWAGYTEAGLGKPHYYRIQGPTIIIEYDNTQNNANHAHSVVRDLQHDFGGDLLLEHYKADHSKQN